MKRLGRRFFNRNTVIVAQDLLGKYLIRRIPSTHSTKPQGGEPVESTGSGQAAKIIRAKIIETEAYCGPKDLANHASKGLTPRTKIIFGSPGHAYIYLIYGMYNCLNIVTEKEGYPAAVLIRSVELDGLNGPGKLCRGLGIDRKLNATDLIKSDLLWVEDDKIKIKKSQIKSDKRIGVDYAGRWKNKLWRFYL